MSRSTIHKTIAVVASCLMLVLPSSGIAQEPTDAQYDDLPTQIETQVGGGESEAQVGGEGAVGDPPVAAVPASGDDDGEHFLALTGSDVLILVAVGASLLSAGVLLRRLSS